MSDNNTIELYGEYITARPRRNPTRQVYNINDEQERIESEIYTASNQKKNQKRMQGYTPHYGKDDLISKSISNMYSEKDKVVPDQELDYTSPEKMWGPLQKKNIDPYDPKLFNDPNTVYSGSDCLVIAQINNKLILIANIQTITYSTFVEKSPVRVLGRKHPKMYTSGGRTISGSMVFAVFDQNPVYSIIKELHHNVRKPDTRHSLPLPDMIPPIDLILLFENEYGHKSILKLYAVEFFQEGQTHSVNDIYTENVMQYVCRDMDIMIDYKDMVDFKNMLFARQVSGLFTDHILHSMLYQRDSIRAKIGDLDVQLSTISSENTNTIKDGLTQEERYKKQLKIKQNYVAQLNLLDTKIKEHEHKISGWNAQNTEYGSTSRYKLEQAPIR